MTNEEKKFRAKKMRARRAIAKQLNYEDILDSLYDIQSECEELRWYEESDHETLVDCFDGDEDELWEFKILFSGLAADCEQMIEDLQDSYIPKYFNDFFAFAAPTQYEILGWDSYEGDYFGIDCEDWAKEECGRRLMNLTKKELLDLAKQSLKIAVAFIGLQSRYDDLSNTIAILKEKNLSQLATIKEIDRLYEQMQADTYSKRHYEAERKFDIYLADLPQQAWIA